MVSQRYLLHRYFLPITNTAEHRSIDVIKLKIVSHLIMTLEFSSTTHSKRRYTTQFYTLVPKIAIQLHWVVYVEWGRSHRLNDKSILCAASWLTPSVSLSLSCCFCWFKSKLNNHLFDAVSFRQAMATLPEFEANEITFKLKRTLRINQHKRLPCSFLFHNRFHTMRANWRISDSISVKKWINLTQWDPSENHADEK